MICLLFLADLGRVSDSAGGEGSLTIYQTSFMDMEYTAFAQSEYNEHQPDY